jgi:hypothetical protein
MTSMNDAALFEFAQAVEATVTGFKAAQERHGLQGLWFDAAETWDWFSHRTTFLADMRDDGYEGDHTRDLSLIKQYTAKLRDADLYVAPRTGLLGKARTTVWIGRSKFLDHIEYRRGIAGYRGARSDYDANNKWNYHYQGDEQ